MRNSGIGGQAVMEGVMMKNKEKYAVAVRKSDGDIVVDTQIFKAAGGESWVNKTPIIRGVFAFIDSLRLGIGTLMYSTSFFEDEEEDTKKKKKSAKQKEKEDKLMMTLTVVLSVVLAVGIFMLLPFFLSQLLKQVITSPFLLTLCEGLIRIILFVGYILAISCMKDIKRVFMYHGAEHKSINCIENGCILSVDNVRKQSRRHKRCGTSFLLIVMIISVFFFMFIRVEAVWLRIVLRLLLVPVIAGISYEFIKLAGRSNSKIVDFLSKPGLALQGLTTAEPDDEMIEVAIASIEAVFDWKHFLANYDDPEVKECESDCGNIKEEEEQPVKENKTPVKEDRQPVAEAKKTVPADVKPVKEDKRPAKENKISGKEDRKPAKEDRYPVEEDRKPVKEDRQPVKEDRKPVKEDRKPVKEDRQPVKEDRKPVKASEKPVKEDRKPIKQPEKSKPDASYEEIEAQGTDDGDDAEDRRYVNTASFGRFRTTDLTKPFLVEDEDEDDDILKALDKMFTIKKDE